MPGTASQMNGKPITMGLGKSFTRSQLRSIPPERLMSKPPPSARSKKGHVATVTSFAGGRKVTHVYAKGA